MWIRLVIFACSLMAGGIAIIVLVPVITSLINWIAELSGVGKTLFMNSGNGESANTFQVYLSLLIGSLPMVTVLWLFRTHDIRQQIERTKKIEESANSSKRSICADILSTGLRLISSDSVSERGIGLAQLALVRRESSEFSNQIDAVTQDLMLYQEAHSESKEAVIKLRGAKLKGVKLRGSIMKRADFEGADLEESDLEGAHFGDANLQGVNLKRANLKETNLEGACLKEASLRGACLKEANLQGVDLEGANLDGADFERADLKGINLKGAYFEGAFFERADLKGVDLEGLSFGEESMQSGAGVWTEADFEGANLKGINLKKADLKGANLEGADLRGANLKGAILEDADWMSDDSWQAFLEESLLDDIISDITCWRGANLKKADLKGADLRGADLQRANLTGALYDRDTKFPKDFDPFDPEESEEFDPDKRGLIKVD